MATTMRVLSANLCLISPPGNIRRGVHLGLAGMIVGLLALGVPSIRTAVLNNVVIRAALAGYWILGSSKAHGPTFAILLGIACLLDAAFFARSLLCVVSVLGYIWFTVGGFAQICVWIARKATPNFVFDAQEERIERFGEIISGKGHDVVVLQEVTICWGKCAIRDQLIAQGAANGLKYSSSSGRWPVFPSLGCTAGFLVMSRYPITKSSLFTYSRQAWFEWSMIQRGSHFVELQVPEGPTVAMMNVHCSPGFSIFATHLCKNSGDKFVNPMGLDQILESLDSFEEFAEGADQVIAIGDFNVAKDSHAFTVLADAMGRLGCHDCFPACPPTYSCSDEPLETLLTGDGKREPPMTCDHVFSDRRCLDARLDNLSGPLGRLDVYQQVSDHRAIEVTWELPAGGDENA